MNQHIEKRAYCNGCMKVTNQELRHQEKRAFYSKDGDRFSIDLYQTLQCKGCGHFTFRLVEIRDHITTEDGTPIEEEIYYPPKKSRPQPAWLNDLVWEHDQFPLVAILDEIYAALYAQLNTLVCIGIRTLIDMIMMEKVGDCGSLTKTLFAFRDAGYITEEQRVLIDNTLEAGSAAAHRGHRPDIDELNHLLDIAESVIENIFIFPKKSEEVSKLIPPRPSRNVTKP